jgi:hypothetical protein
MSALAERIAAVGDVAPIGELSVADRTELDELVGDAEALEDLPGRWQAAVLEAELRAGGAAAAPSHGGGCCHGG